MILGLEIVLTVLALYMLFAGRPFKGKSAAPAEKDWRYRLIGGLALTVWPVLVIAGLVMVMIYAAQHPEVDGDAIGDRFAADWKWYLVGAEAALVLSYWGLVALGISLVQRSQQRQASTEFA